jgi:AcrR family transcriptional regulator
MPKVVKAQSHKRSAIVTAAGELFVSRGYDGTSMEIIAEAANVSRQTVYNQFESKEALFRAIVDDVLEEFMAPLVSASPRAEVRETLISFAEHTLGLLVRPKVIGLCRLAIAETARFPDLGLAAFEAGMLRAQETIAQYLRNQARDGKLELTDPFLAAGQFMALTSRDTELRGLFGIETKITSQEIRRRAKAGVDAFLKVYRTSDQALSPGIPKTARRVLRRG